MGTEHSDEQGLVLDAKQLNDDELIARLKRCVAQDRQLSARMLEHLGEVEARGLYRDQGYSSMFNYAVHGLHMSESEAGLRLTVARFGRTYPRAIQMLARGELHMTAIRLLVPVLTPQSLGLLEEARFKSKQQVLELRAKHFPQPHARTMTRRILGRTSTQAAAVAVPAGAAAHAGGTTRRIAGDTSTQAAAVAVPPAAMAHVGGMTRRIAGGASTELPQLRRSRRRPLGLDRPGHCKSGHKTTSPRWYRVAAARRPCAATVQ